MASPLTPTFESEIERLTGLKPEDAKKAKGQVLMLGPKLALVRDKGNVVSLLREDDALKEGTVTHGKLVMSKAAPRPISARTNSAGKVAQYQVGNIPVEQGEVTAIELDGKAVKINSKDFEAFLEGAFGGRNNTRNNFATAQQNSQTGAAKMKADSDEMGRKTDEASRRMTEETARRSEEMTRKTLEKTFGGGPPNGGSNRIIFVPIFKVPAGPPPQ
ncbi:MAG TPA: hypothetical protein VHB73_00065 [Alphaproteobacteria bacterium]|nr:hypothetical protein [Alphaproteobacteria bacterium]